MNIIIHRGASQIGGCITEIRTSTAKIVIDLGCNLPGCQQPDFCNKDIVDIVDGANAILYTHYHGDHIGFMSSVPSNIPQYIGVGAQDVIQCKYAVLNKKGDFQEEVKTIKRLRNYYAGKPLKFGDLKVTPFYCSHSAFDAYMFKIEWKEKIILHTGDFRKHGYMGSKLIPMVQKYIGQVDVLITEGTMLSRQNEIVKTEFDIQNETKDILRKHKYVFALGSSTDIDRLASFHAACKTAGRYMYIDRFQESVLDIFTNHTTSPFYDFSDKGKGKSIFVQWQYQHHKKESVINEMKRRGFLMPVRSSAESLIKSMMDIYKDEPPVLIYSMWSGYWKGSEDQKIESVLKIRSLFPDDNIFDIHTSGHADCATLSEVCLTTNPKVAIIPIHKDANTDFRSLSLPNNLKEKVVTKTCSFSDFDIVIK